MKVKKRRFMQQLEVVFAEVLGLGYYAAERITQIGFVLSPAREIDELNSPRHFGLTGDHHNPHSQV